MRVTVPSLQLTLIRHQPWSDDELKALLCGISYKNSYSAIGAKKWRLSLRVTKVRRQLILGSLLQSD